MHAFTRAVLLYIRTTRRERGYSPTPTQIADGMGISLADAKRAVDSLIVGGYLKPGPKWERETA